MTDDTLREECEALIDDLRPCIETEGSYYIEPTRALNIALAFARAQQAKGLREAAKRLRQIENYHGTMAEGADEPEFTFYVKAEAQIRWERLHLEAQATAREQANGS